MMAEAVLVRRAGDGDLGAVKRIADANKLALGFVTRATLAAGMRHGWLAVAESAGQVVGFVHYRHRKDSQTTLYEICVVEDWRRKGVGHLLLRALVAECASLQKASLRLKCPQDLQANKFYERLGFLLAGTESGKVRTLNVWELTPPGWGLLR